MKDKSARTGAGRGTSAGGKERGLPSYERAAPRTFTLQSFLSGNPGQGLAVAAAIATQLHRDLRWPPNDINKVMGADYRYDVRAMAFFLGAVRWNLAYGNPNYYFNYNLPFINAALGQSVGELTGSVDANTSDVPPAGWIAP